MEQGHYSEEEDEGIVLGEESNKAAKEIGSKFLYKPWLWGDPQRRTHIIPKWQPNVVAPQGQSQNKRLLSKQEIVVSKSHVPHVPPSGDPHVQSTSQPKSPRKALESEPKEDLSHHSLPIQKLAKASEYDKNPSKVFASEISSDARIRQKVEKSKVPCQMVTSEDEPVSIENSHQIILLKGSDSQPQHENDEGPTPMIYEKDLGGIKEQSGPNVRYWRRIARA
nr:hypothetical protein CFP56_72754 [Quercus suber]